MEHVPVQIGSEPPSKWDEIEARQANAGESANGWLRNQKRPAIADADLDWAGAGLNPHWVGTDSVECAAALEPSPFHTQGAEEFERFRGGAKARGETALVISPIGKPLIGTTQSFQSLLDGGDSVSLGQFHTYISGRILPSGGEIRAAAGLSEADKDLARRLRNSTPGLRWRHLSMVGPSEEGWQGRTEYAPEGTLVPILETALGEAVAAVWLSPDGVERRYIVPVETPWSLLLGWLMTQALPEYVPAAMRRARRNLSTDIDLMTRRERDARAALTALRSEYQIRERDLLNDLMSAESAANSTRDALLYGTGGRLVDAVRTVLESANLTVVDLDEDLGDTKNADLMVTHRGRSRLVEVKSASGSASERSYEDLMRHLREWPHLPGCGAVEGGALIFNHQYRHLPEDRSRQPFSRPEFLAAASEPIITTLSLLDAWREEDDVLIRSLLFGSDDARDGEPENPGTPPSDESAGTRRRRLDLWRRLT